MRTGSFVRDLRTEFYGSGQLNGLEYALQLRRKGAGMLTCKHHHLAAIITQKNTNDGNLVFNGFNDVFIEKDCLAARREARVSWLILLRRVDNRQRGSRDPVFVVIMIRGKQADSETEAATNTE